MKYTILDWKEFLKKAAHLTGKDLEIVNGTEIHRGPVQEIGYDPQKRDLSILLPWAARLTDRWRTEWSVICEDEEYKIEFVAIGSRFIEWEDGRVTIDDPLNPLAPTYSFLTKESNLKLVRVWE